MKRLILLISLISVQTLLFSADKTHILSGTIVDNASKEPIIGATIIPIGNEELGVTSDQNGDFCMQLTSGEYKIECRYMGYVTLIKDVSLQKNTSVKWALSTDALLLESVVVTSNSPTERIEAIQIGAERIEMQKLMRTPALFGQQDLIRSLTLLPGIKAESDVSSGFQVRGGTNSQNLILLDEIPVYRAGHVLGIFSAFNDDIISSASLYKGMAGAEYSGGTSSVLDIGTKKGDMSKYSGNVDVGILSSSLYVEGPIWNEKISFSLAARRSYGDLFLKLSDKFKDNKAYYYDLNGVLSANISKKDILKLSFFMGQDVMGMKDMIGMNWRNRGASTQWFHRYNENFTSKTSLIWSEYDLLNEITMLDMGYEMGGLIHSYGVRHNFDWQIGEKNKLKIGFQSTIMDVMSGDWTINEQALRERRKGWDNGIWVSDQWKITPNVELLYGLRLSHFAPLGGAPYYEISPEGLIIQTIHYDNWELVENYFNLEPRLSMNYMINEHQSLKAGYSRTTQNIHALSSSNLGTLPFDRNMITSNLIKPQVVDQVSVGYTQLMKEKEYEATVEVYYKHMNNIYDIKDGKTFSSEIEIERIVLAGKGRSYGAEITARKNVGKLTGWIGYTLSFTQNKINGINNGEWYTASNDRRHDISIVGIYDISKKWQVSGAWIFNTGQALTAPSAKYEICGQTHYYYTERNGYRAPNYHRLDLNATYTNRGKHLTHEISFGAFNIYHRYNPFMISFESDDTAPSGMRTTQTALFGIIPSVTYGLKF